MRSVLVAFCIAMTAACGGGDGGGSGPTPTPTTVNVAAGASGTVTSLNATRGFTATVLDQNSTVIGNASVSWTASPAGIVTLNPATGLTTTATAVGNGTATITARSGTVSGTQQMTVSQSFNSLDLTPNPGSVTPGGTLQMSAVARDPGGAAIANFAGITFTSQDQSVATVNNAGLVSGVAVGTTTITADATSGGATHSATATVNVATQTFPLTADVTAGNSTATFTPQTVDIRAGGVVTWTFGALTHNVNFSTAGAPANIPTTTNNSVSRTFAAAGVYPYECNIHAGMSGTVVVH